jgi:hypothetical protein
MIAFEHALLLLLLVAALNVVGRWLPWPHLITYLIGEWVAAALVPGFPTYGSTRDSFSSASCPRSSSPTAG